MLNSLVNEVANAVTLFSSVTGFPVPATLASAALFSVGCALPAIIRAGGSRVSRTR